MSKNAAFGTMLRVGNGEVPEGFTTIGQVKDIEGPNMSRENIDVTTHDSPQGFREFIPSLRDGGEVTFDIEYDPSLVTHGDTPEGLLGMFKTDNVPNWQLIFPIEGSYGFYGFAFTGYVSNFSSAEPVDGSVKASITIKVAGATDLIDEDIDGSL